LGIFLTVLSALIAAASLIFVGVQTRILAKQTRSQNALSHMSFNFQAAIRLQEILFQISDDPDSYAHIWGGKGMHNRRPDVAAEALLDIFAMTKAASTGLPGFAANEADWDSYIDFVLTKSSAVKGKLLAHSDWWPELASFMEKRRDEQQEKFMVKSDGSGGLSIPAQQVGDHKSLSILPCHVQLTGSAKPDRHWSIATLCAGLGLDRARQPAVYELSKLLRPEKSLPGNGFVGFQDPATGLDLGGYAARSYSLIRPPRTGRRLIRSWDRSATGWSGRGGRSWRLR
jgi:hypothetical protein